MLRQLSTFLADTSLALNALDSVQEVLTLVAEQARELLNAECALACVRLDTGQPVTATSCSPADAAWTTVAGGIAGWVDVLMSPLAGGTTADAAAEVTEHPVSRALRSASTPPRVVRCWLAAPITALDGRELGSLQLFDKYEGAFTDIDGAVLGQLAQMASAAVDRAQLYGRRT